MIARPFSVRGPYKVDTDTRAQTYDRPRNCYGHNRAEAILRGLDEAANRDLALWRNLGGGR